MLLNSRKIKVEIRFLENPGSVRAYADVTLTFADGELQLIGCAIVAHPGKSPFVAYPANRGNTRYFPVVTVKGDLHKEIVAEILRTYKKAKERE
jgi:DNA-binding cell septation regulator SpoVG